MELSGYNSKDRTAANSSQCGSTTLSPILLLLSCLICIGLCSAEIRAQTQKEENIKELKNEIAQLKMVSETRFEKLENQLKRILNKLQETEKENEIKKLMEEAQRLSLQKTEKKASMDRKFSSGIRQQSALNPNISVGGDYYYAYGTSKSDYNRVPSDGFPEVSWGTGKFMLREMEVGFQSALDPYSRAKVFFSFTREGVYLEEGYAQWLNMPLNMNLKIGEIKTQFGKLNRYHDHALPQFERPLVLTNFFGITSLKGFGLGANFLLPSITAQVNELDLEMIDGGMGHCFTDQGDHRMIYVAHLKNYFDINRSTYVELGFSGALGHSDTLETHHSKVAGADLTLKWAPPERAKYRGIEWRSEFLYSHKERTDEIIKAWGFYSSLQARLNAFWIFSARIDYSQLPWDSSLKENGFAVCFDYWQSEFVFIRAQYTRINRNFDENDNRFICQINWAMGPHKHEAY